MKNWMMIACTVFSVTAMAQTKISGTIKVPKRKSTSLFDRIKSKIK